MNIALIGLGMVARTHVSAIQSLKVTGRLAGVMSRDHERAKQFIQDTCGDQASTVKIYSDVSEIAADSSIDAVDICTPPNARRDLVASLAAAGKHILIEKPIERTLEAATEIVEICETHGVQLGVFLQHRMRESAKEMRTILENGSLGRIALVEICVPWWREQTYYDEPGRGTYERDGGGVLISQSIHTLDLALSLLGPVSRVQAMAHTTALHNMESEDYVTAGLEFTNGAVGSLVASTASFPGRAESIIIHGTKGSAKLIAGKLELSFRDGTTKVYGEDVGTGGGADPMAFTHGWHQAIIEDFLNSLRTGQPAAVSGRDALQVHALIETLIQSSEEGRAIMTPALEQK